MNKLKKMTTISLIIVIIQLLLFINIVNAKGIIQNKGNSIKNISNKVSSDNKTISNTTDFINTIKKNPNANITLTNDLNFLEYNTKDKSIIIGEFTGTLDGNGFAITNIKSSVFNTLENATIKNLVIDKVQINNNSVNGVMANSASNTTFKNIHIINTNAKSESGNGLGAFIGSITSCNISNVSIRDTFIDGHQFVGGFIGINNGETTIENVLIETKVTGEGWSVGGFIGRNQGTLNLSNSIIAPDFVPTSGITRKAGFQGNSNGTNMVNFKNVLLAPKSSNNSTAKRVISSGNAGGVNVYDWIESPLEKQTYAWLTEISETNINDNFFKETLKLSNEIWEITDTNISKTPVLKSEVIVKDYLDRVIEVPEYLKTVEQLDEEIKSYEMFNMTNEYKMLIMQRNFMKNLGYDYIKEYVQLSESHLNFINWLLNDYTNLHTYTMGGTPDYNNYKQELTVLKMLYDNYKDDLEIKTLTEHGNVLGDVYRKMFFSIGKGYAITVRFWTAWNSEEFGNINSYNHPSVSHPVERYKIFKKLYEKKRLGYQDENGEFIRSNLMFEKMEVEEMRYVMNAHLDDPSLEWLNWYIDSEEASRNEPKWNNSPNSRRNPYTYIDYSFGFQYNRDYYGDDKNFAALDEKFKFSQFGITDLYKESPKPFVVFEEDAICWGISKAGADIWNSIGVPANAVSQPGHLAYVYSTYDATNDKMYWGGIYNAITNWGLTGEGGPTAMNDKFHVRMPLTWGDDSSVTGWNASYMGLSQEVLNNFTTYENSRMLELLSDTYKDEKTTLASIYKKAIDANNRNYGAWLSLTKLYKEDTTKTTEDYVQLLEEISTSLSYAPLPMYDLFRLILPNIKDNSNALMRYNVLLQENLERDSKTTKDTALEHQLISQTAKHLLGNVDTSFANFSFDGENENTIKLSETKFGENAVVWDYSLDGGKTWTQVEEKFKKLSSEEIKSITSDLDILVHIVGVSYDAENIFTIDITEGEAPTGLHANDLENRVIGTSDKLEWYNPDKKIWEDYTDSVIYFETGNISVRRKATKTVKASPKVEYSFTKDNQEDTRKYYFINKITSVSASSHYNDDKKPTNMIDGNPKTNYYTTVPGDKFMIYSFDEEIKLSAVEYVPYGAYVGRALEITVLGSLDGENFTEIKKVTGLSNDQSIKKIEIENPTSVKFVKIIVSKSTDGSFAGTMFNFFEDVTNKVIIDELEQEIIKATEVYNDPKYNKTDESKNILLDKIKKSEELLNKKDVTQEEIDFVKENLIKAVNTYINSKDKETVEEDNKEEESDKEEDNKDESTNNKLEENKEPNKTENNNSSLSTENESTMETTNKEELKLLIEDLEEIYNNLKYNKTKESKDLFLKEINKAKELLNKNDITQEEINNILTTLEESKREYINSKEIKESNSSNKPTKEKEKELNILVISILSIALIVIIILFRILIKQRRNK